MELLTSSQLSKRVENEAFFTLVRLSETFATVYKVERVLNARNYDIISFKDMGSNFNVSVPICVRADELLIYYSLKEILFALKKNKDFLSSVCSKNVQELENFF